jgi:multicomponent Na+:H+ antiporter subunit D
MPLTTACCIVGALSISGFPLTSGFTTKSLISQAAADAGLAWVYMLLIAASAGVFLHAGIKFPWFVFFQRDSGLRPADAPRNMALAMLICSALSILLGLFPQWLYNLLPYPLDYRAYSVGKVVFYLQLLLFSGLAFFLLLPLMKRTDTVSLDVDWLWRRAAPALSARLARVAKRVRSAFGRVGQVCRAFSVHLAAHYLGQPQREDSEERGLFARSWAIGTTALWIAILLSAYVLVYYL